MDANKKLCQIGLVGLAVMGRNLALNFEEKGFGVALYNRTWAVTQEMLAQNPGKSLQGAQSLAQLCSLLEKPRKILLMVKAGEPVDETIRQLLPLLEPGDMILDGGNSQYQDTIRRVAVCAQSGVEFAGVGISGGEEGARRGPAIMPGCSKGMWQQIGPLLQAVAARVEGQPCCVHIGENGAGHFVKTVHNGIEYADMALISECSALLAAGGYDPARQSQLFAQWNRGRLESYLIEITADILGQVDEQTGRPMVQVIRGKIGNKGTGKWTSQESLELGEPAPTIAEAVFARYLSQQEELRGQAANCLAPGTGEDLAQWEGLAQDVEQALYCAKLCAYAQGFALMGRAAQAHGWQLDFAAIARIFRGGCIIRAQFLNQIARAYTARPNLPHLLLDGVFAQELASALPAWRRVATMAVGRGVAAPALLSALSYYDGLRDSLGRGALLAAQRDYFGAHTFERLDMPGHFHRQWF